MQEKNPTARKIIQTSSFTQSLGVPVVASTEGAGEIGAEPLGEGKGDTGNGESGESAMHLIWGSQGNCEENQVSQTSSGFPDQAPGRFHCRAFRRKGGERAQRNRDGSAACARPTFHQPHPTFGHPLPGEEGSRSGGWGGQAFGYLLPPGEGAAQRRMRGGAGPRPVPPLTRPSARPRKRGSPRSRRERERAAADEGHSCRRDCSLIRLQGLRSHLVAAEYLGDSFNNSLQAMEDLVIGDSDHPQPKAHEPGFPGTITGPSVGMAVAVNLQDQTRGMTVEVHDVRSDHHLPTKLPTRQATVAESVPD